MKPLLYILLLLIPLLSIAQLAPNKTRGEVFRAYNNNPSQDTRETTLEVTRTLYGLRFKDESIPEVYKKAIERFFKENFRNKYRGTGTFTLNLERKRGYLYIENRRIIKYPN